MERQISTSLSAWTIISELWMIVQHDCPSFSGGAASCNCSSYLLGFKTLFKIELDMADYHKDSAIDHTNIVHCIYTRNIIISAWQCQIL